MRRPACRTQSDPGREVLDVPVAGSLARHDGAMLALAEKQAHYDGGDECLHQVQSQHAEDVLVHGCVGIRLPSRR